MIQGRHIAIMSVDGALLGQRWTLTQVPSFDVTQPDAAWTVEGAQKYRVEEGGYQETVSSWFLNLLRRSLIRHHR